MKIFRRAFWASIAEAFRTGVEEGKSGADPVGAPVPRRGGWREL